MIRAGSSSTRRAPSAGPWCSRPCGSIWLTPVAGSHLDLREAVKAAEIVRAFGRRAGKPLRHCAVLTRVPPMVKPRTLARVVEALRNADIQILPTPLLEKEAFRAVFSVGGGFDALEEEGAWGVASARLNTAGYVADVVRLVGEDQAGRAPSPTDLTLSHGPG